jgi:phage terminase small subunit
MKKLTRKEIAEGLKSIPVERILLGATPSNLKLTKKQKTFAEEIVKTGNKTEAYRRAYNTTGKRETASRDAHKIANNPNVSTYVTALTLANEAEEYLLPQRLRTMAIHKLSNMALNDDLPPAQQLKALELIGKMSEVSLFAHRTEVIHKIDSESLRTKLMDAVQLAISRSNSIHMKTKRSADELLKEINGADTVDAIYIEHTDTVIDTSMDADTHMDADIHIDADADIHIEDADADTHGDTLADGETGHPLTPTTPDLTVSRQPDLHSIPHTGPHKNINQSTEKNILQTHPLDFAEKKREGGI